MRFSRLVAIRDVGRTKGQAVLWECQCDCGNLKVVPSIELRNGHTKSCGCLLHDPGWRLGNKSRTGKPHTEETKAKMSRSGKGRSFTAEHCENIRKSHTKEFRSKLSQRMSGEGNPMYGKVTGPETKAKISLSLAGNKRALGHRHTPEVRTQMSIARSGRRNPNWIGGGNARPYDPYCSLFRDDEFRDMIFERDEHQCQNPDCWQTTGKLCPHHINYNKQDCSPTNLITLCLSCNTRANAKREWHQEFYGKIMQERYERK